MIPTAALLGLLLASADGPPPAPDWPRVGLQVGWGTGGWAIDGRHAWLADALARHPWRLSAAGGWEDRGAPGGRWRFGARGAGFLLRAADGATRTQTLIARAEVSAALRPPPPGPAHARVSAGPAFLLHEARVPGLASGSIAQGGGALSLAFGLAAPTEDRSAVQLEAEGSIQGWIPAPGGPRWSWCAGLSVGFATW